jgi:glycosyltransferase involved in cell wall biosynthesis
LTIDEESGSMKGERMAGSRLVDQAGSVSSPRSLTVAIPGLNEERNIENTVRAVLSAASTVPGLSVEVLVVDDGSTDRTAEIVEGLTREFTNVRLLKNPQNMGLGASIRRAIEEAQSEKFIFIPGDNDIPASTLELLFRSAYVAEVVMCYFHNDECRGRIRYLISTLFTVAYTTAFDLYVQYINGPAVYPIQKLRQLKLRSTRFSIVAEINVKLLRQGATFVEVPSNRQVGLEGSTSLTLPSLLETLRVLMHNLLDVHLRARTLYARRPVRLPFELSLTTTVPAGGGGTAAAHTKTAANG